MEPVIEPMEKGEIAHILHKVKPAAHLEAFQTNTPNGFPKNSFHCWRILS